MIKIEIKDVRLVPVGDIKRNPKNRNKHPEEQIAELARHYEVHGMRTPIIVSNQSGQIVAGDGRFQAALKAKMKEVPVTYQDFETPEREFAFGVADNGLSFWSELDLIGINDDLKDMPSDFNLADLGLKDFKVIDTEVLEPGCDEDAVPEHVEPKTKPGDLYKLGNHRLLCGDSTNIQHVEKLMDGEKAHVVFTDPPYGYKYESNHQSKHSVLMNDDKILDFMPCASAVMDDNSCIFVFGSHQTIHKWRPLIDQHFTYKNLIVWKKNNWSMGDLTGAFAGQHELILFAHKGRVELMGERSRDVWEFKRDPPENHPTQKPIELIEFAITKTSSRGDTVLDLFGGSGSTTIAAEKSGRKSNLMELDPKYCDVIVARWEKYTGQKAELISG